MQVSEFSNGGFVCHAIKVHGYKGRFSAWFAADRTLLDAECIRPNGNEITVRKDTPLWAALAELGRKAVLPWEEKKQPAVYTYIVQQWLTPGPGSGHWYECRRVRATNREEAIRLAFPPLGQIENGYRLVSA